VSFNKLRAHRSGAGLTQVEVAEKVGVSGPTYARWEAAAEVPSEHLTAVLDALGVEPDSDERRALALAVISDGVRREVMR